MPAVAPTLLRDASRIESGHVSKKLTHGSAFDDAHGAIVDMRSLARCALVIVDDKIAGTYALSAAAAGRLAPCADPGAWLEQTTPGYGTFKTSIAGRVLANLTRNVRVLCHTDDLSAPVIAPAPFGSELGNSIRYDLSEPWHPRLIPPHPHVHVAQVDGENATGFVPPGCEDAYHGVGARARAARLAPKPRPKRKARSRLPA
jgi:hypothetical protein